MKKLITIRLCVFILLSMVLIFLLSLYLQVESAKEVAYDNSIVSINQIAEILRQNDNEIELLKKDLAEDYFIRARAAAYIVQNYPAIVNDQKEMKRVAALLQTDEIHLFNKEGVLFSGSEPKYYNYTFNSGEQMKFFLPMLEDTSLQLCQEITPNTAEGKMMQYIAVWREDKEGIVQIGMEPVRLMEAMERNELPHIFSMMSVGAGVDIFAANPDTGELISSTDSELEGKTLAEIGVDLQGGKSEQQGWNLRINGVDNYCVIGETGDVLVGVMNSYDRMFQSIPINMLLVILSLCFLSMIIILLILKMLDRIIISSITQIVIDTKKIAGGDLDYRMQVCSAPEFLELSDNINLMVKSLLETTNKLSLVFQNVDMPIAVYEYSSDMKRVLATNKINHLFMLSESTMQNILSDKTLFQEKIRQIMSNPYEGEKDIYILDENTKRYLKINNYQDENRTLGIVTDVTDDIVDKQRIRKERDVDLLTELSSRRAFYNEIEKVFQTSKKLKNAVLMMADVDNLKYVNDNWGHGAGDLLLKKAAEILNSCSAKQKLVARLGGDEFVLLVYGEDSKETLQGYIDTLQDKLLEAELELPNQKKHSVSLSGGYIFCPEQSTDYEEMMRLADQVMYEVKKSRKGWLKSYSEK